MQTRRVRNPYDYLVPHWPAPISVSVFGYFTTDTPVIYCYTRLNNAPPDTVITSGWAYDNGEAVELIGSLLNETSGKFSGTRYLSFSMIYDPAWPKGNYSVTVLLNGEEKYTVPFTVEQAQVVLFLPRNPGTAPL